MHLFKKHFEKTRINKPQKAKTFLFINCDLAVQTPGSVPLPFYLIGKAVVYDTKLWTGM